MRCILIVSALLLATLSAFVPAASACGGPSDVACVDHTSSPTSNEECVGAYFVGARPDTLSPYVVTCAGAPTCRAYFDVATLAKRCV